MSAASFAQTVHAAEVAQADPGSAGYQTYCASCHQPDGQGMAGAFPPLAGSDYLLEDPTRGITAVLEGVSGTIEVNGVMYESIMPHLNYLSDEQISQIVTYVLNAWGNDGGSVTVQQVAQAREQAGEGVEGGLHAGTTDTAARFEGAPTPLADVEIVAGGVH